MVEADGRDIREASNSKVSGQEGGYVLGRDLKGAWGPSHINVWRMYLSSFLLRRTLNRRHNSFILNLGHSLQYLEFLDHQLDKVGPDKTIYAMTTMTFSIYTISVLEKVLYYIILAEAVPQTEIWEKIEGELKPPRNAQNSFDWEREAQEKGKRRIYRLGKGERRPWTPPFATMIDVAIDNKLLNVDRKTRSLLGGLRELRNRIHPLNIKAPLSIDSDKFDRDVWLRSKRALRAVLFSMQSDELPAKMREGVTPDGILDELLQKSEQSLSKSKGVN